MFIYFSESIIGQISPIIPFSYGVSVVPILKNLFNYYIVEGKLPKDKESAIVPQLLKNKDLSIF